MSNPNVWISIALVSHSLDRSFDGQDLVIQTEQVRGHRAEKHMDFIRISGDCAALGNYIS